MKLYFFSFVLSAVLIMKTFGQIPQYGQEFQINTFWEGSQQYPEVAVLANRNFVVGWFGLDSSFSETILCGQLFNYNGEKIGNEFRLNTYPGVVKGSTINSSSLAVAASPNNGFTFSWVNNYRDGDGRCVVAQIFDSSGTKQGDEFIVNTTTSGTQFSPSVSYVDQDRFVVAWGGGIVLGNNNQIYCQVFNDQGQKIGNEILVPTTLAGYKWKSTVLGLNDNTFVVSWSSTYEYESIYCQKFDLNGNKIGSEVRVNNFDVRSWHSLATTDNGFIVIWSRQYSPTYVEAQILDLNLNLVGSPIRISDGGPNTTLSVDITRLSNNCYATVWAEFSDVYCQLLDSTLSKIGFNFILNDYRTSIQEAVRTEAIPGYGFVNCWHSYGNDGRYYGIFGKIMPDEPVIRALNSFNLLVFFQLLSGG